MIKAKITGIMLIILLTAAGCQKTLYSVTVKSDGQGEVVISYIDGKALEGGQCPSGSEVAFKAVPADGWEFSGWSGLYAGKPSSFSVLVKDDLSFTAEFSRKTYSIDIGTSGEGTVSSDTHIEAVAQGETVTLDAVPSENWQFTGWTGDITSSDNPLAITVEEDVRVIAGFARIQVALGTVTAGSGNITITTESEDNSYYLGETAVLTAEADSGWHFSGWAGAVVSDENPLVLPLEEDVRITARFARNYGIAWKLALGGEIFSTAAVAGDGTIYIGSENGRLTALTPEGKRKWIFFADDGVKSSPAIGSDGTIYVGSRDKHFYAVSPDGQEKWNIECGGSVESSPAIGPDGTIYFGSGDRNLYAVTPEGDVLWTYVTGSMVTSSPAIGVDGTIFFGSMDRSLYAVNPDGTLKWRLRTSYAVETSPAVGRDGTIYYGSADGALYAVTPGGKVKWNFRTGGEVFSSPVLDADGNIYFGSDDYHLYAVDPDGEELWKYRAGSVVSASALIGGSGTVYFGSDDGFLYALDKEGTLKWKQKLGDALYGSPVIGNDGNILTGSLDGKISACTSYGEMGLEDSPWPKFRGTVGNTGEQQ